MSRNIKVGITQGDTNGVGCEIILKSLSHENICELFTPVIIAGKRLIDEGIRRYIPEEEFKYQEANPNNEINDGKINLITIESKVDKITPGVPTRESGSDAVQALKKGVDLLREGKIDVLVTAPFCKENVQSDEFSFPGHTEFLEAAAGNDSKAMMILYNDQLRVALVSIHVPLSEVVEKISKEKIVETVMSFDKTLKRDFGIVRPRIALLSLNPHCGDGGLLGKEEKDIIEPAIKEIKEKDVLAYGPYSSDGFFGHGDYSKFDGIVAMYHDQGLAPFKILSRGEGVNFTAGLPFIRTSPDHGTAFPIAGKGIADETSMRNAIYGAVDIFRRRKLYDETCSNPLVQQVQAKPDREERTDAKQKTPNKNSADSEKSKSEKINK